MSRYNITLHTPLGPRMGILQIMKNGSRISGFLNILKQAKPIAGRIDPTGRCCFFGTLVTLTREIPYQAEGNLTGDGLELSLTGKSNSYRMTGQLIEGDNI